MNKVHLIFIITFGLHKLGLEAEGAFLLLCYTWGTEMGTQSITLSPGSFSFPMPHPQFSLKV